MKGVTKELPACLNMPELPRANAAAIADYYFGDRRERDRSYKKNYSEC